MNSRYIKRKVRMDHYSGPVLIDTMNYHVVAEGEDEISSFVKNKELSPKDVRDETCSG